MGLVQVLECFGLPAVIWGLVGRWQQRPTMADKVYEVDIIIEAPSVKDEPCPFATERKPPSPCFVGDVHEFARTKPAVRALLKCQRTLIQNYLTLGVRGVFAMSVCSEPVLVDCDVHGHPIQDPAGALTAALLVVRRNRPLEDSWMKPPFDMNLVPSARRGLAAMLCVCQKMAVSQGSLNYYQYVQYVMQLFLLPDELPKWRNDWEREFALFDEAEMAVVTSEPLLSIMTSNPLAEAEVFIGELVVADEISKYQGRVLRGCCFFLIGSCLMNPAHDVLEELAEHVRVGVIGRGVVSLLLTLHHLANSDNGYQILYRAPYDRDVDHVAQVMLSNATSGHANQLRVGPYRASVHAHEKPHEVQKIVSPANLSLAKAAFQESMPKECAAE